MTHLNQVPQRIEGQNMHYILKRSILRFVDVFQLTKADNASIADSLTRLSTLTDFDDMFIEINEIKRAMDRVSSDVMTSENDEQTKHERIMDIDECIEDFNTSVPLKLGLTCVSGCDSSLILKRLHEYAEKHQGDAEFQLMMTQIKQDLKTNSLSGTSICNQTEHFMPLPIRVRKIDFADIEDLVDVEDNPFE